MHFYCIKNMTNLSIIFWKLYCIKCGQIYLLMYTHILKKYDDWCLKLFATLNFYILLNIGFGKWSLQLHIHTTTHTYNFTQWKRPLDVGHMQLMNSKAFLILTFEKLWHKEILSSAYCLFHSSKGTYFFFDSQKASYKSFKFN